MSKVVGKYGRSVAGRVGAGSTRRSTSAGGKRMAERHVHRPPSPPLTDS